MSGLETALLAALAAVIILFLWDAPVTAAPGRMALERQFQRAVVVVMGLSVPTAVYLLAWLARYLHG